MVERTHSDSGHGDRTVLEAIRRGDSEAWSQLVDEYQGRLLRFAMARVPQRADAEDIVQNTFASLVKIVDDLQLKVSLETYLFGIARNEIGLRFRTQQANRVCLIQDIYCRNRDDMSGDALAQVRSPDPSTSGCVIRNEERRFIREALTESLRHFVKSFQKTNKLHRLKMAELLFYCQLSNSDVAKQLAVGHGSVRIFKHRCLEHIRAYVARRYAKVNWSILHSEDLLSEIWEEQRLSCVKRSTLGVFMLEDLPPEWFDYVDFHLTTLGCHFCRASYKDLQEEQQTIRQQEHLRERILASTRRFSLKTLIVSGEFGSAAHPARLHPPFPGLKTRIGLLVKLCDVVLPTGARLGVLPVWHQGITSKTRSTFPGRWVLP